MPENKKPRKGKNQKLQDYIIVLENHLKRADPVIWVKTKNIQEAFDWEEDLNELFGKPRF